MVYLFISIDIQDVQMLKLTVFGALKFSVQRRSGPRNASVVFLDFFPADPGSEVWDLCEQPKLHSYRKKISFMFIG